ncbi:ABC transporter permease [Brassicibacter mesophilus]|uniref:ABC transporter permease n=1 Tax=Brassicibacter mesophilus TaxID=745119 RepID=UPI003D1D1235
MAIRKKLFITFIIILLLIPYFFLKSKYNYMTMELRFSDRLTNEQFLEVKKKNNIQFYSINYIMPKEDENIIMTTGMDYEFKKIFLEKGEFVIDFSKKEAVIGDNIVDKYFSRPNVIGENISVLGRTYKVIAIEDKSSNIYIPYSYDLIDNNWEKRVIKFETYKDERPLLWMEKIQTHLRILGVNTYDPIIYREIISLYINIIILLIAIVSALYFKKNIVDIKNQITCIKMQYQNQIRTTEWHKFLKSEKGMFVSTIKLIIIDVFIMIFIIKLISYLVIPLSLVPDNLFSLNSYVSMAKYNIHISRMHMLYGYNELMTDMKYINILIIIFILLVYFKFINANREKVN